MDYESPMIQSLGQDSLNNENQVDAGVVWQYAYVWGAVVAVAAAVVVVIEPA
ncbi:hypothetical protein [Clostridium felsineum]|uniref:Uncharacterized protein n=1 Tax=Clostridium felsineum TaxID=36839 RepID=A0A1S8LUD9_9CLOT|nr:hypothetical protein [Clostridium felsineum]URZ09328.1 hypothetical protein CLROS_047440 [Clostridium felsineum]URZ14014.1 hypothetical protein CROST_047920 [Clostridium felsineum]